MRSTSPFVYNTPVPPDMFVGRTQEIDQILGHLANPARINSAVFGDPHVGKTSLLHYLVRRPEMWAQWGLAPTWCHVIYVNCHSLLPFSEANFWRYILRTLQSHVADEETLSQALRQLLDQPAPDTYDLNNFFDNVARRNRLVVLLLDEFEGVVENLNRESPSLLYHLRVLVNRPERGLVLVTASRKSLKELCAPLKFTGSPFDNTFSYITLFPFSDEEVEQLLEQYRAGFSESQRAQLRRWAGTQPYLVQLAASLLSRPKINGAAGGEALAHLETTFERETESYFADVLNYLGDVEQMLLVFLALAWFARQLPAGSLNLPAPAGLLERYDHELAGLIRRGLVVEEAGGPAVFSPILGRWALRRLIVARGQTALAEWEPIYRPLLPAGQSQAFQQLAEQLIIRPGLIRKPELFEGLPKANSQAQPAPAGDPPRLGRYVIQEQIGRGQLTDVFRGYDPHLDRPVAIKRLRATLSKDEEIQARFKREAKVIAALRHPHILQIYDLEIENRRPYMVMEFVEGRNLKETLHDLAAAGQRLSPEEVLRIISRVADALDYAHHRQMIHRDIKPANILLGQDGGVFLADFGLVRLMDQPGLTQIGQLIGTLAYMAPEQFQSKSRQVDHRADIYALACVLYEMLTGRPPFTGTGAELAQAHLKLLPAPPGRLAALPEAVDHVLLKALAKDPAERPHTAVQFIEELRRALNTPYRPIQLTGPVRLAGEPAILVKQLYAEESHPHISRIHVDQELSGGLSGAQVLLIQPIDARGRGLARDIVKIGPATMLRREFNRYREFVKGRLPVTAVSLDRGPVERGVLACLAYGFAGDRTPGAIQDLEAYYAGHPAEQVIEVLARLMKPLDNRWYGQSEPLLTTYAEEYGQQLPAHLRLRVEHISAGMATLPAGYRPVDTRTLLTAGDQLKIGARVVIPDLQVNQVMPSVIKLCSVEDGPRAWVRAKIAAPRPDLQEKDQVIVAGVIEARRDYVLTAVLNNTVQAYPALERLADGRLRLEGLDDVCPDPLAIYPQVLARQLDGRRSIIHGDLHPGNILVDDTGQGWLIDFDHVHEGHVLYDFIRLETLLRLFILGGIRRTGQDQATAWPHAFSLAEYAAFEAALLDQTLGRPPAPPARPDLAKAAEIILAIRGLARPYLRRADWGEYLTGLFLQNLAQFRFYETQPQFSALPVITAAVVGREVGGE